MSKFYIHHRWWPRQKIIAVEYRCEPVPGTRCRRGACYGSRWHTRPATQAERRAWFDAIDQGVTPRRRRSAKMLPTAYEDKMRGDYRQHNWKRFRKTQWK